MQPSDIVRFAARDFEMTTSRVPAHFYAPEQVIDAIEDECLDSMARAGVPFTRLVNCDVTHVHGLELHTLPTGDHRIFATDVELPL